MNTNESNGVLTVFLEGRVDTNNAAQTEAELFEAVGGRTQGVVIDAAKLEYISSAGLRVLLKLRKKIPDGLPFINVSSEVYEILETTGFTDLLDVKRALRELSVEGCEKIGAGGYGTVYRLDSETILKLYDHSTPELIDSERIMSQRAFVNGLPTAIPFDMVKVGENYGVVYEMLESKTLAQLIDSDPENYEKFTRLAASELKKFHSVEIDDELFHDKKQLYYDFFNNISDYLTDEENKIIKDYLDSIPYRKTFLHGDYNFRNIMLRDDELMLIDVGDAGIGHPVHDVGGVYVYLCYIKRTALSDEYKRKYTGFDIELTDKVWQAFLEEYFGTTDKTQLDRYVRMVIPAGYLASIYHSFRINKSLSEEEINKRVNMLIRGLLIPAIQNSVPLDF